MRNFLIFFFLIAFSALFAQSPQPPATPAAKRMASYQQQSKAKSNSLVSEVPLKSVGPTVFGGRIVDLAVDPADPTHFYAAYASGGLFETKSNGTRFTPIFDQQEMINVGDIAVNWKHDHIWVGTGENNSSRSSYSGVGIYLSRNNGKTWEYKGLPESHHIGRIILHPTDTNTVWVAALGHLYSPNKERGVYKTTDGGENWTQVLYVDENSGAIDLVMDPKNPNTLYAATWDRERRAWNFVESGDGSMIHKSTDGGNTWTAITTKGSGFPSGEGAGRIGLAITTKNDKTRLYAIIDNYDRRPAEKKIANDDLTKDDFRDMTKADFLKLDKEKIENYLRQNNFPKKYSAKSVLRKIKSDEFKPAALTEYLENANSLLFDTQVVGAEVYVSDDDGKSWTKTHEGYLDDIYYSYGYYFGQIRVSPRNPDKIYIYGVPILKSDDGGKTFKSINGDNVHVDHHALWISPSREGHLILGNDGGVNISYDDGESWYKCNTVPAGQFYAVAVDNEKPYNIYGGLQDNGVWVGSSRYKQSDRWHNSGKYPYQSIIGGDGMQVQIDSRDVNTVYTGFQYGFYYRFNRATNDRTMIQPKHELGERPLRWNWQTPIHLSVHQPDILYMGSNFLHRSFNKGDDFSKISKDLTKGGKKGDVGFGTLTSIHESPLRFGLIYVGTDDGNVHMTPDGGYTWKEITKGLPTDMWVTRVQASMYDEATVYASLNGYRWDDFTPYLYRSTDYGQTWQRIGLDLPIEPINVIKEDPTNKDLLYVGTDQGLYISLDNGLSFMQMYNGMPNVAVHDLVVQNREKDLIVGTHGRSIYLASVKEIQQMTSDVLAKDIHLFDLEKVRHSGYWGNKPYTWGEDYLPKVQVPIYSKNGKDKAIVKIETEDGVLVKEISTNLKRGLNYVEYDMTIDKKNKGKYESLLQKEKEDNAFKLKEKKNGAFYLEAGKYKVMVNGGNEVMLNVE